MKARALHHVSSPFASGDEGRLRAFYSGVLGLTELTPPASLSHLNLVWFQAGPGTELHLFEGVTDPMAERHFCLDVDDLEQARALLVAAGAEPYDDVPIPGRPRFFCRDPAGNLIEFTHVEAR